jgi:hypothetical protein
MELLGHLALFTLAAFAAYGHLVEKRSRALSVLVLVLPSFGVYWLGALALVVYIAGYLLGAQLFIDHHMHH